MEAIRRMIERMLRCTDSAIAAAQAMVDVIPSSAGANETYRKSLKELKKELLRQRSGKAKKTSCAKACLEAYLNIQVFGKLESLLRLADEQAALVASTAIAFRARWALLVRRALVASHQVRKAYAS